MVRTTWLTTRALVGDTFREAFARLIFWGFYGLSTALILFFLFILKIDVVEGARASISIFGQMGGKAQEVGALVRTFHGGVAAFLYTYGMALAIFASGGLIPTVLEPGRIELLLSKPVTRHQILLGRYLGNVLVTALNICYLVVGVWLIFGWKTGIWSVNFLFAIPSTVFMFAVLLSVVMLTAVLFESAALAVMVTFGLMLMSPILAQTRLMEKLLSSAWSRNLWKTLYGVLPKFFDMGRMTLDVVRGKSLESWMPVWSSALFAAAVLGAALVVFSRRDY
jgi:ABC-type transport system involved in multi-copper enzyme maturation permease subunit